MCFKGDKMEITIKLPKDFFEEGEKEKLEKFFNAYGKDFDTAMNQVALASISEYKEMFLGRGLPSRADEIQQHRLNYLIKYFYTDVLPSESDVANMFQLTLSRSKSLIRFVLTRFHYELESKLKNTLAKTLQDGYLDDEDKDCLMNIQSWYIVEEFNRLLSMNAPKLYSVRKIQNVSSTYAVKRKTYEKLQELLVDEKNRKKCGCKWE